MRPLPLGFAALLALSAAAQDPANREIAGLWQGVLRAGAFDLRLVLEVKQAADGALSATLDSIDQGAEDLPVDQISFEAGVLELAMKALRASFRGEMAADGQSIAGTFTQGGRMALTWTRTEQAPVLVRPQEPSPPYPYRERHVYYSHDPAGDPAAVEVGDADTKPAGRVRLAGTLTLPETGAPHPAVVLVSGSGPQDRDETLMGHRPFLVLADALTRRGIAVLRYDDRGVGESTGDFRNATTADFARDALAGVHYLRTRDDIAHDRIGIVGHSEGGLVGPIAANDSEHVALLVLMAAPSVTGEEVIVHQGQRIAVAQGATADEARRGAELNRSLLALLRQHSDSDELEAALATKLDAAWDEMPKAVRQQAGDDRKASIAAQTKQMTTPWFRFFLAYDPVPALQRLRCPLLAVFGEKDLQVDPQQSQPPMQQALAAHDDATILVLEGLNHLFQTCETGAPTEYGTIEETIAPAALQAIGDWIVERFGG
jgi:pimeloyl-ACP methyl ester carboxylesterase